MAYINRKQIREKIEYKHDNRSSKYYGSMSWKKLRDKYYVENSLCESCLAHDSIKIAEHVHHIRPFLTGRTDEEKWQLLLNENNLMSLCAACHTKIHKKIDQYQMLSCDELTDAEYNS